MIAGWQRRGDYTTWDCRVPTGEKGSSPHTVTTLKPMVMLFVYIFICFVTPTKNNRNEKKSTSSYQEQRRRGEKKGTEDTITEKGDRRDIEALTPLIQK